MLTWQETPLIIAQLLVMLFFLVPPLFLGLLRYNPLYLDPPPKLSIILLHILLLMFIGFDNYYNCSPHFSLEPPVLCCDNVSAISLANNPGFHVLTRYIEIDYHFVREKVSRKDLSVHFVSSHDQVADLFTKPLSAHSFQHCCGKFMTSLPS